MSNSLPTFKVEVSNGGKAYQTVSESQTTSDRAIFFMISVLNKVRPGDSVRMHKDGVLVARKTPKAYFLNTDRW